MTQYAKRFSQRVTAQQRKHLEDIKDRTGTDINTQIMQLIQADIEAKASKGAKS